VTGHPHRPAPRHADETGSARTVRSVSFGGGVQSTCLLVLAAQGSIDFKTFLFANVGHDSEHPDTLRYVHDVAMPYAASHGIELLELQRIPKKGVAKGQSETVWGRLTRPDSRSLPIPVRMSNGAPGTRGCTADWKVRVVGAELRRRGATVENPATVALGISVDEIERAKPGIDPKARYQRRVYPLLDLGLRRSDCQRIIADAGLRVPRRSACYFCPLHSNEEWRSLKRHTPELFERACWLESHLNERRRSLGKDEVWLTRYGRPLAEVIDDQLTFDAPGADGCDSGWCMT
jgi:hypothetical protein